VNNPQSQALEAFRFRPVVSAVLIVLLALLIFVANSRPGDEQGLGASSAMQVSQAGAVGAGLSQG
jgi:hypothetical protein